VTGVAHFSPDEFAELTLPQLAILTNNGELPNPRRRTFASNAEAEAYLKATAVPHGAQPQTR